MTFQPELLDQLLQGYEKPEDPEVLNPVIKLHTLDKYVCGQVCLAANHSSIVHWSNGGSILIANSETYPTIDAHKMPGFPSTPKSNLQSIPYRFTSSHRFASSHR